MNYLLQLTETISKVFFLYKREAFIAWTYILENVFIDTKQYIICIAEFKNSCIYKYFLQGAHKFYVEIRERQGKPT
jgi:hypothetical protein